MTTQTLEAEKFEALRERYDAIDGVAQAGLTTADGRLLRQSWSEDNDCLSHRSASGGVHWRLIPAFWFHWRFDTCLMERVIERFPCSARGTIRTGQVCLADKSIHQ